MINTLIFQTLLTDRDKTIVQFGETGTSREIQEMENVLMGRVPAEALWWIRRDKHLVLWDVVLYLDEDVSPGCFDLKELKGFKMEKRQNVLQETPDFTSLSGQRVPALFRSVCF